MKSLKTPMSNQTKKVDFASMTIKDIKEWLTRHNVDLSGTYKFKKAEWVVFAEDQQKKLHRGTSKKKVTEDSDEEEDNEREQKTKALKTKKGVLTSRKNDQDEEGTFVHPTLMIDLKPPKDIAAFLKRDGVWSSGNLSKSQKQDEFERLRKSLNEWASELSQYTKGDDMDMRDTPAYRRAIEQFQQAKKYLVLLKELSSWK